MTASSPSPSLVTSTSEVDSVGTGVVVAAAVELDDEAIVVLEVEVCDVVVVVAKEVVEDVAVVVMATAVPDVSSVAVVPCGEKDDEAVICRICHKLTVEIQRIMNWLFLI